METLHSLAGVLGLEVAWLLGSDPQALEALYEVDPRQAVLDDRDASPGLRNLAADDAKVSILCIDHDEWRLLRSINFPEPPRQSGYELTLLFFRALRGA